MPHVSSKKLKQEYLQKLFKQLSYVIKKSAKNDSVSVFLKDFLTSTERAMFAKRFAAIYLLSRKLPVSYVCEALQLSPATMSRMSNKFKKGDYNKMLSILKKEEKEIWNALEVILRAGLSPRIGRGRWKFLYEN